MKKILKALATIAVVAVAAWAMRDRFFSIPAPKEPGPPQFRVVPGAGKPHPAAHDLTVIRGVGPVYAARMEEAGFTTLPSIAAASPELLAEAAQVTIERAKDWAKQAASLQA